MNEFHNQASHLSTSDSHLNQIDLVPPNTTVKSKNETQQHISEPYNTGMARILTIFMLDAPMYFLECLK